MIPIEVVSLSKSYRGKRGRPVEALKGVDLSLAEGEVFGFLGPNGAGKSTTIKTLMGQIKASSGTATLFGLSSEDPNARRNVGYLPENPAFYDFLTAREYLALIGRMFGMDTPMIKEESDRVLELMGLTEAMKRPIRGYSKGMVQRLGLAQTLLHDPDLYILDEPMSGLDPTGRSLVKNIMLDLKSQGKSIFFSTHVIADVESVCDRVGIVVKGRLKAENSVAEILQQGIEGYRIRLDRPPSEVLLPFVVSPENHELYAPRETFNEVMGIIKQSGHAVSMVEPQRKSLEDFFLNIISQAEGTGE